MAVKKKTTRKKAVEENLCTMQLSEKCRDKEGILPITEFYTSYDTTFYANGKFNICKNCMKEYIYSNDQINLINFKTILRIFNIPYFEKEFKSAMESNNETIGTYMKNLALNHKDAIWLDSDDMEGKNVDIVNEGFTDRDLVKRWGYGFTMDELQWLEENYHEWTTHHECDKLSIQRLVQMICIKELEIRNARQNGKPTDKLEKALMELMNNSNLTPRNMSAVNESDSSKIFGIWLKDIEQHRPAEYFKDKKIYHDFDGIGDYFERFILRPMKNLLVGTREFDKEFTIEDDNGGDE